MCVYSRPAAPIQCNAQVTKHIAHHDLSSGEGMIYVDNLISNPTSNGSMIINIKLNHLN